MKIHSLAVLFSVTFLAGCGASTSPVSGPSSDASIAGNWQLTATSTQGPYTDGIGVNLISNGAAISGLPLPDGGFASCIPTIGTPCGFPYGYIFRSLAGTIGTDGKVLLNTVPPYDGADSFSITANSPDGATLSGTYTISLVSSTGTFVDQGTLSGYKVGNIGGTYSGTVKSTFTGLSMSITTTLSQSSSVDANGYLELNGSASFIGSQCLTAATAQGPGVLVGSHFRIDLVAASTPTTTVTLLGTLSQDGKSIAASYGVNGACGSDSGAGTLTVQ